MPTPTDRLSPTAATFAPWHARLLVGTCVASAFLALACDPDDGREGGMGPGRGRLEEAEDAIGPALSQAAAHVRNESNWVSDDPSGAGADGGAADGGDMPGGDGGGADGGGTPPAGSSCAASCGGASSDGSCYCDAECTDNGDCCSDYAAQCGGGGGTDPGAGDGGGGAAGGTCAGVCGGASPDGSCYCDGACTGNGDCCTDYAQQCGGGGGGDGGGGGGGATCNGYCGGLGSDGACYCDDQCQDNGDCCDDFASWCAVGIGLDPAFDLAAQPMVQAGDGACWGIITDPVDVERIGTAASVTGIAFGTSCVAVVVVPAGAGAVPTGGISVGAAALACSTAALAGGAAGGLADLASQKMGAIAQCGGDIMASVMQIFPWGVGEKKVEVPVYTSTPADPGNCTPDQQQALQQDVTDLCKNAGSRSCSYADACPTIATKIDVAAKCIEARQKINSQCYNGGDDGHKAQVQQEVNLQNNCYEISTSVGC